MRQSPVKDYFARDSGSMILDQLGSTPRNPFWLGPSNITSQKMVRGL
jgi:hypothetical protein